MNPQVKSIYYAFDSKLVGSKQMKQYVCETVALLPENLIEFVTMKCWFISAMDDAWAFTFTGNDLKDQHLIFLNEELLMQGEDQIRYSIAHEIGHVVLNHRNSVLVRQTKEEIRKQERQAHEFAKKYLSSL